LQKTPGIQLPGVGISETSDRGPLGLQLGARLKQTRQRQLLFS
jgi:hypothetical protein